MIENCDTLSCAFTGHRPQYFPFKYDETDRRFKLLYKQMAVEILELYNKGVRSYISGMALGVDIWAATLVLRLKNKFSDVKLICAISCKNQSDKWSDLQKAKYNEILKMADEVVLLQEHYTDDCMLKRNKYMVDRADILLAVYDDAKANPRSGTGFTIRYANSKNKEVVILNPLQLMKEK